jgi:DNA-directed RNA polymerase subunit RPC12/RpoP
MAIQVECRCGKRFAAQPHLAGKRVACPSCSYPITIPQDPQVSASGTADVVVCECGKRFRAQPHLAGKTVRCPACQQPIHIPKSPVASAPSQTSGGVSSLVNDPLWDDFPSVDAGSASTVRKDSVAAAHAATAAGLLSNAHAEQVEKKAELDAWATGKIVSGIAMTIGAAVWFIVGLLVGRIFFYPPILFVVGVVAVFNGISYKLNR